MTASETLRSGGQLLAECLASLGARHCFGVPGESYLDLLDALHDKADQLPFINCRNEGGAAFMAEAYSKLTGTPGVCMVTRGPGATNSSIGIHSAMQASTPMLLLIGQVGTDMLGREAFQEVDYRRFFGDIAKWVVQIDDADRIPEIMSRAWSTMLSGRPGPVVVALPENMLTTRTSSPPCQSVRIPRPAASPDDLQTLLHLLGDASKPVVMVGGNGWNNAARSNLQSFLARNQLPVVTAFRYHDVVDNHYEGYAGNATVGMPPAVQSLLKGCDLLLAIGVRFGEISTNGYTLHDIPNPAMTLIHAHASADELGKIFAADLPLHCNTSTLCSALASLPTLGDWSSWRDQARAAFVRQAKATTQPGPVDMSAIMAYLQQNLPTDAIITNGAGNFAIWPNKHFLFGAQQRLLAPQSGAMGYGVPAAIAAKVAHPERTVVCFAGDGDFQMNGLELATAAQHGAQPIILVLNNSSYGTIRMHQERHYPQRISATNLINPDFVGIAQACGFHGEKVETTDQFIPAFERSLASSCGALLEITTSIEAITPSVTLSQLRQSTKA